jgi:hypothetical protein
MSKRIYLSPPHLDGRELRQACTELAEVLSHREGRKRGKTTFTFFLLPFLLSKSLKG